MQIFNKRPLFAALSVFVAATSLFVFISPEIRNCTAFVFLIVLAIALFLSLMNTGKANRKFTPLPFLLFGIAVAAALMNTHSFVDKRLDRIEGCISPAVISGQIRNCEHMSGYESHYIADIQSLDGDKLSCALLLIFSDEICVSENEKFTATVQIEPFARSEYGFNTRAYRIADGIFAKATVLSYHADAVGTKRWQAYFEEIADTIGRHFDRRFDSASAALAKALLLGDKSDLQDTFKRDIRRLGVSHILAVSGTHFSVVLGMATVLLSLLGCSPKIRRILLIPISIFYMAITGFSPSVVRAGLMTVIGFLAFLCGRQKDALTALTGAVALYILVAPHTVYSVGLWLSFVAALVILLLLEFWQSVKPKTNNVFHKLFLLILWRILLSVLVFAVTLPICALAFGEVSVASLLGNLTVVPLLEFYIYIIAIASIAPEFPFIANVIEHYAKGILHLTCELSSRENLLVSVKYDFVIPLLCIGITASFILVCFDLKHKRLTLLPLLLSFALTAGGIFAVQRQDFKQDLLYFYSCFGGEGILLKSQNRILLLDISDGQSHIRKEADYLSANTNCPEIYGYALTHYHKKHIQSLRALCTFQKLIKLYLPPCSGQDELDIREELLQIAAENRVSVEETAYEVPISHGKINITLCTPQKLKKSSHAVCTVWIENGENAVLYCPASACETHNPADKGIPDFLLIGFHTPRQKEEFTPMPAAQLIFANEDLASLSTRSGRSVRENGYEQIRLN